MDPELWDVIKRYSIVGVVLTGALVWAVTVTPDAVANNAPLLEAPVAPLPADVAVAPVAAGESKFIVVKHDLRRISCSAACDLEASCELRKSDACVNESCEGDVRKINRSDFHLEGAANCAEVAASPCEEACWKKAECGGRHDMDAACTAGCMALMKSEPQKTWRQARCILEVKSCHDVTQCDKQ